MSDKTFVFTPEAGASGGGLNSILAMIPGMMKGNGLDPNHRLSTQRLSTFYSGRFPSTRLRTVHTGLPVHGSPPSHSV